MLSLSNLIQICLGVQYIQVTIFQEGEELFLRKTNKQKCLYPFVNFAI